MNLERLEQAKQLAAQPYGRVVMATETTDAQPVYYAVVREIPACSSQGGTVEAALANLREALVDYVYFLLEDELPVPVPEERLQVIGADFEAFDYWQLAASPGAGADGSSSHSLVGTGLEANL